MLCCSPFLSISISTLSKMNIEGISENNFPKGLKSVLKVVGYLSSYHECLWGSRWCSDLHFREKRSFLLNQPIILSHGKVLQVKGRKMSVCIRHLLSVFTIQHRRNWLHHHFLTDGLKHVLVKTQEQRGLDPLDLSDKSYTMYSRHLININWYQLTGHRTQWFWMFKSASSLVRD